MASSDSVVLTQVGDMLLSQAVSTSTFTLFLGVFALLYAQHIVVYMKTGQKGRAQDFMFLISTVTFLLAIIHEAALLATTGITIHSTLIGYQNLPLMERPLMVNRLLLIPNLMVIWTSGLELIICDSIVFWRVFFLLRELRWLVMFPLALLLGSTGSLLAYLIIATIGTGIPPVNLIKSTFGLSIGTNAVSTALIGYVYWSHRKFMTQGFDKHRATPVEQILALLVESGVVFCVFQVIIFGIDFFPKLGATGTAGYYAKLVFEATYFGFSAMYPTMVIVLVNNNRTLDRIYTNDSSTLQLSNRRDAHRATTINFAVPSSDSSTGTFHDRVDNKIF